VSVSVSSDVAVNDGAPAMNINGMELAEVDRGLGARQTRLRDRHFPLIHAEFHPPASDVTRDRHRRQRRLVLSNQALPQIFRSSVWRASSTRPLSPISQH
jgi:hypothetical protein